MSHDSVVYLLVFAGVSLPICLMGLTKAWGTNLRSYQIWWGHLFGFKAWHFLPETRRLRYHDDREVKEGETISAPDPKRRPSLCFYGMHGSIDLMDAFSYAPGPILCRVTIWGQVVLATTKLVGRHRKCLKIWPDVRPTILKAMVAAYRHQHWVNPSTHLEDNPEVTDELYAVAESVTENPERCKAYVSNADNMRKILCTENILLGEMLRHLEGANRAVVFMSLVQPIVKEMSKDSQGIFFQTLKEAGIV